MGGVVSGEEGDRSDGDAVFAYKLLPQNKMKKTIVGCSTLP